MNAHFPGPDLGDRWIDFSRTFLTFQTKREASVGRFQVDAICDLVGSNATDKERWFLGSMVIAGNVYAPSHLVIQPAYSYQIICSRGHHQIFRDYGPSGRVADTAAPNRQLFETMHFAVADRAGLAVTTASGMVQAVQDGQPLVANLRASGQNGVQFALQFPIKHVNVHPARSEWQVESGPVPLPTSLRGKAMADEGKEFDLAYMFFNRRDKCEFAIWEPKSNQSGARFFSDRLDLPAEISILAPDRDRAE